MQSGANDTSLHFDRWSTAIVGNAVDDRGHTAIDFASKHSSSIHTLIYDSKKLEIIFDGTRFVAEDIKDIVKPVIENTILLEATTLRITEILLFLKAIKKLGYFKVSLLYLEPEYYRSPHRDHVLQRRDFELSDNVEAFLGIPGSLIRLKDNPPTRAVFLLGYEGERLDRALDETGIKPSKCSVVFGVPAFRPGWEMDSFANNVNIIVERKIAQGILFAGAQNPLSAFESIKKVYDSCGDKERLIIGPIGTKPHGIGAALFACEYNNVGVIYDYPAKRQERSRHIGNWHLFNVDFDQSA